MTLRFRCAGFVILSTLVGLVGCGQPNPSSTGTGGGTPSPNKPTGEQKPEEVKPDFVMTIQEYGDEFEKGFEKKNIETDAKYSYKTVEVTGQLLRYDSTKDGMVAVIGTPNVDSYSCMCELKDPTPWKTTLPGQTVKVLGKVKSAYRVLYMKDGAILSSTGDGPATRSAIEVAKEYKTDQESFIKKYAGDAHLILTGDIDTVIVHEDRDSVEVTVTKKSDGAVVTCFFNNLNPLQKRLIVNW